MKFYKSSSETSEGSIQMSCDSWSRDMINRKKSKYLPHLFFIEFMPTYSGCFRSGNFATKSYVNLRILVYYPVHSTFLLSLSKRENQETDIAYIDSRFTNYTS